MLSRGAQHYPNSNFSPSSQSRYEATRDYIWLSMRNEGDTPYYHVVLAVSSAVQHSNKDCELNPVKLFVNFFVSEAKSKSDYDCTA